MQLLVIRHAIAEDRDDFATTGRDDSERPLTDDGRRKMRGVAKGLRTVVPTIDLLASSPFTRAMQTAEIVASAYDIDDITRIDALTPEARLADFLVWVQRRSRAKVVAIVGHEPHLSQLITWLLSGLEDSRIEMKKGGAALIDFDGQPGAGVGTLTWLLPPRVLRQLG